VVLLRQRVGEGVPKAVLAYECGVSRETMYPYLRAGPDSTQVG